MKMKRTLFTCVMALALLCACLFALPSKAEAATVQKGTCGKNLTWVLNDNGTLTISGTGAMTDFQNEGEQPWWSVGGSIKKVVIKSGVTTISAKAFAYSDINSISIAKTVTTIGDEAFNCCYKLESITIPAGVTSIGKNVFSTCPELKEINVNSGNSTYSSDSRGVLFNKNKTILLSAPGGISGAYAVPGTVETIEACAFKSCGLQSVTIPNSVTSLGEECFYYCSNLQKATLSKNITRLEKGLFYCAGLQSITIPESVTFICNEVFEGCRNLEAIYVDQNNPVFSSDDKGVLFNKEKTVLLRAPGKLTGRYIVPTTVTQIDGAAFTYCFEMTGIALPDNLKTIETYAFWDCSALKEFHIPAGVISFGNGVLDGCTSLEKVTVAEDNAYFASDDQGGLFTKDMSCLIVVPAGKSGTYIVPDSVTMIQSFAFAKNEKLKGVFIPDSVEYLGNDAFYYCSKLSFVMLPSSLEYIDYGTFNGCSRLKKVYYQGSQTQWENIEICSGNEALKKATICYNSTGTELAITAQPKSVVVEDGSVAKVTVKASGDGLTYTWYHKSAGTSKYKKSSVTGATYTVRMSSSVHGRYVYCVVTDMHGNTVQTNVVRVKMGVFAKIITQPKSVKVAPGQTAKVSVKAVGDGLKYQWYYAKKGATGWTKTRNDTAKYTSAKMSAGLNGCRVRCVVTDKYGNSVKSVTVTLYMDKAAKITAQPVSAATAAGKTAKVTIKATGDGLKYTWYHKRAGETKYTKSVISKNVFSVKMSTKWKKCKVYCVVKDKYGTTVKSSVVTLKMK